MSVAFRAITYATLFIAFLLVYLPSRVLLWSGIIRPSAMQARRSRESSSPASARPSHCGAS